MRKRLILRSTRESPFRVWLRSIRRASANILHLLLFGAPTFVQVVADGPRGPTGFRYEDVAIRTHYAICRLLEGLMFWRKREPRLRLTPDGGFRYG